MLTFFLIYNRSVNRNITQTYHMNHCQQLLIIKWYFLVIKGKRNEMDEIPVKKYTMDDY